MNLELLDPQMFDIPESVEVNLDDAFASVVKFNRRGNYLAAGRQDGRIIIYDFDTKSIARVLDGHVKMITAVSWSRDSRHLLSASRDCKCIVWDLLTGVQTQVLRFETPVLFAQFHPRNRHLMLATFYRASALLVDLKTHERLELPTEPDADLEDGAERRSHWVLVARFNRRGDRVYTGTSQGYVNVIDTTSRRITFQERVSSSSIRNMAFDRKARDLVVNSNDRTVRVFSVDDKTGEFELQHKFQDLVNRTPWNQCSFSSDGDYVIGGSGHKASHNIYIWDASAGNLIKILEGPKDSLEDLDWHPVRPILASVSSIGSIHIWANRPHENWSALAPDFLELEENREYSEREDEFDIIDDEAYRKNRTVGEDEYVDVVSTEGWMMPWDSSDDEPPSAKAFGKEKGVAEDGSFYLPIEPEPEPEPEHSPEPPADPEPEIDNEPILDIEGIDDEEDVEEMTNGKKRSGSSKSKKTKKRR